MDDDRELLGALQLEIGRREKAGDRKGLERNIAPALAFLRADGSVVDRAGFLDSVRESPARPTEVTSVKLYGNNRAVVECIVTRDGERFHNLRLFIRHEGEWKLLAWANEPESPDPAPASVEAGVA